MGFVRGVFVLLFPLAFTVIAFILSIIIFFSSYQHASALKNINFLSVDFSNLNVQGISVSSFVNVGSVSTFGVGTNGFCYGSGPTQMTECLTPHEPFYFNIREIFDLAGVTSAYSVLPSEIRDYDNVMKDVSYAIWGCFLATICLAFLQGIFGILAIFSIAASRIAEVFATLGLIASILGSGMATGMYLVIRNKINSVTSQIGVTAAIGHIGLGVAWGTCAALFLADVLYVMSRCFASRRPKYVTVPDKGTPYY